MNKKAYKNLWDFNSGWNATMIPPGYISPVRNTKTNILDDKTNKKNYIEKCLDHKIVDYDNDTISDEDREEAIKQEAIRQEELDRQEKELKAKEKKLRKEQEAFKKEQEQLEIERKKIEDEKAAIEKERKELEEQRKQIEDEKFEKSEIKELMG